MLSEKPFCRLEHPACTGRDGRRGCCPSMQVWIRPPLVGLFPRRPWAALVTTTFTRAAKRRLEPLVGLSRFLSFIGVGVGIGIGIVAARTALGRIFVNGSIPKPIPTPTPSRATHTDSSSGQMATSRTTNP